MATADVATADAGRVRAGIARRRLLDRTLALVGLLALLVGLVTLAALLGALARDGAGRLTWAFLTSYPSRFPEAAGILPAWVGTALVMLVTALAAVPLGVGAGVYLEEYARRGWLTDLIEVNIANLAAVPSIVYGLMALGLFVHRLRLGQSILAGGLTLALLILPVVIVATREAIRAVPLAVREAAYALGATRWQVVRDHVVPYALGGILTGVIIGLSRAIGETAPLITVGALTFIAFLPPAPWAAPPGSLVEWLLSPFTVLPIQMFNWISRPQPGFHANAAAAGLVLAGMTLAMNALAIYVRYRFRRRVRW